MDSRERGSQQDRSSRDQHSSQSDFIGGQSQSSGGQQYQQRSDQYDQDQQENTQGLTQEARRRGGKRSAQEQDRDEQGQFTGGQ